MTHELTRYYSGIDAAKDRRGPACVNSAPKGAVKLTQQSPPALISAGPKPGINADIDARIDAQSPCSKLLKSAQGVLSRLVGVGR